MFNKTGIIELHNAMHERLDLLLAHVATVPDELRYTAIAGFGHPSIWKQLVHILTCEEGWVHDLQNETFAGWSEKIAQRCPTCSQPKAEYERRHRLIWLVSQRSN